MRLFRIVKIDVPALLGATRFRVAPSIGLRRHRPWAAPRGANPKRGALILLAAFALSGCQTTRYVSTYCLTKAQLSELQAKKPGKVRDKLTGKADTDLKLVAGRLVRVEAWGDGLLDILGGCTDPNKP